MAKVEVVGLEKAYRGTEAVRGLSFEVEDGEFFCLLGPPGAGKTTVFRIIAGLEQPDAGNVLIDGESATDVPPQQRDVAMVFEDMALYPHMTAFGNIAHPLYLQKVKEDEREERVHAVAEQLQIGHLLNRRPATYSGGERRRVALARGLVRLPRALLLDQALSDLDAKIRQQMAGELKRLQRETGQTMIYATHDYEEAIAMGDRILVMKEGKELQTAGPEEVYWTPATKFVAAFVGTPTMNFLPVKAARRDGEWQVRSSAFSVPIPRGDVKLPEDVIFGIRPEHIQITAGGDPEGTRGIVEIVQVLGEERIVDLRLQDGSMIKYLGSGDVDWRTGTEVSLRLPPEHVYLFDPETEACLLGGISYR